MQYWMPAGLVWLTCPKPTSKSPKNSEKITSCVLCGVILQKDVHRLAHYLVISHQ